MPRDPSAVRKWGSSARSRRLDSALAVLGPLLLASKDAGEIAAAVLRCAMEGTGSRKGYLGRTNAQTLELELLAEVPAGWGGVDFGHALGVRPLSSEPARVERADSGRFLGVPLRVGEAVLGQLGLADAPRRYSEGDREAVERIASLCALALRRQAMESSIRALSPEDVSLFDAYPDGVAVICGGKLGYVNPELCELLGREKDDVLGRSPLEFVDPEQHAVVRARMAGLQGGTRQRPSTYDFIHKDGSFVPVEAVSQIITWKDQAAHLSVFRDLTWRRAAEQELLAQRDLLQTLADFDETLASLDASQIVRTALGFIRKRVGGDRVSVVLGGKDKVRRAVAYVEGVAVDGLLQGDDLPVGHTPTDRAIATGQPQYVPDLEASSDGKELIQRLIKAGLCSLFVVPLVQENVCLGALNISTVHVGVPEDKRRLLLLMGSRLAAALRNAALFDELQQSEVRYRNIFHSVPVSLWLEDFSELKARLERLRAKGVTDLRRYAEENPGFVQEAARAVRVTDVNDYTLQLFGACDKDEVLGSLPKIFAEESYAVFLDQISGFYEGLRLVECEAVNRTVDGRRLDVMLRVEFPPEESDAREVTVSITDVSARKRAEDALRRAHDELEQRVRERTADLEQAKRELERDIEARKAAEEERDRLESQLRQARAMEAVGHLAGGVAHDFNNILGSVMGCLYAARVKSAQYPEVVEELDRAQALCKRGGDLTRQLLTVARRRPGRPEPLLVGPLLEELKVLLTRAFPKTIRVAVEVAEDLPPTLCDRSTLTAALLNLGLNARDAMPHGGSLTIGASVRRDSAGRPEAVLISFADTGSGIPETLQDKVFDPFFTTKGPGEGSGLGLTMVEATVRECRGRVTLSSREGAGSTFTVELPPAPPGSEEPASEAAKEAASPRGRVLIVEDEAEVARMITSVLGGAGYECLHVANGLKALECLRDHRETLGLVVLDLVLPQVGGEEVYRLLTALAPEVPVLVVTGREDRARKMSPPPLVLPKPFTAQELLAAVGAAVSLRPGV